MTLKKIQVQVISGVVFQRVWIGFLSVILKVLDPMAAREFIKILLKVNQSWVKGLSNLEVLQGCQSSFHVQTSLLVFQCCAASGSLQCIFWEILQKLAELDSTEDVFLTPKDGIL